MRKFEPLDRRSKILLGGMAAITLVLFGITIGILLYINSDLNGIARMEFADACQAQGGIALEARQSVSRWPALYCVSQDSIVEKHILNPPTPLR